MTRPEPLENRRKHKRFRVALELQYWVIDDLAEVVSVARATTLDISASGILLSTEKKIRSGQPIVVAIDWPPNHRGACMLKFVAIGLVVRCAPGQIAIRIQRHEFLHSGLPDRNVHVGDLSARRESRIAAFEECLHFDRRIAEPFADVRVSVSSRRYLQLSYYRNNVGYVMLLITSTHLF